MRGRNAFSDLISRLSCSDFQCCASPGADVIQQVSVKRRTDNPKYRRIVPRGRVAIRRQFILKSRGIGRDWSGESGAASSAAFGVVKYSRRGAVIPKVFQPIRGGGKRQLRRAEGEREDSSMVGLSPANRRAFSSPPPSLLSRLFSRLPCHPFTFRIILPSLRLIRPPTTLSLSLHGGRRLINEDLHFSISDIRLTSVCRSSRLELKQFVSRTIYNLGGEQRGGR